MPYCKFCQKTTSYTYRDQRISNTEINLVYCCPECSKENEYLTISSCFKHSWDTLEEE